MQDRVTIWRNALLAGVAFGVLFTAMFALFNGWLPPRSAADVRAIVLMALLTGSSFGVALGLFAGSRKVAAQTAIQLPAGEMVEHAGPANHFLNYESRGGRLYLTNRCLIFQPHGFNVQGGAVSIPVGEIAGASTCMTLGVIPNGLLVSLRDGSTQRFVVSNRSEWVRVLTRRSDAPH